MGSCPQPRALQKQRGLCLAEVVSWATAEPLRRAVLEMELHSPSAALATLREQERLSPLSSQGCQLLFFNISQLISGISR